NKADLLRGEQQIKDGNEQRVRTSALRGEGINELRAQILQRISGEKASAEPGFLTNERQDDAIEESLRGIAGAQSAVQNRMPHEVLLLDLYSALKALDAL